MVGASESFGPFVFDAVSGTLTRDGRRVPLGGRASALLGVLIAAEGAIVSKAELMEKVWPGQIVEDGNITVQMAGLRKALGTREDGSEWIGTVPRVGYRLVRTSGEPTAGATSPQESGSPALAVLPFLNLSGDPEQEYFADGIVEDIITALSRFRTFAVIARNSSFVYKGRAVDDRQVARELGVRYILEGSVRRSGERLRISAKLVEGEGGSQLWAQTFDGGIGDVFDIQDRVTENVAAIVEPQLKRAEIERARHKRTESLDAYDLYLRALPDVYAMRPEANARAIEFLDRAVAIDNGFAVAHSMASLAYLARHTMQLAGADPEHDVARAVSHARAALATGTDDPSVIGYAGFILVQLGLQYDEGFALLRRSAEENPNHAAVLTNIGIACLLAGDLDEAEGFMQRAIRLNPREFDAHWQLTGIAHIRMAQGRFEEALTAANRSLALNAGYDATYWMLIAAYAHLGRLNEAHEALAKLKAISPHVTLARIRRGQRSRDPHRIDVLIDGMRLAGMPEG